MKTLGFVALTLFLAGGTLFAHATDAANGELEQCKSQVSAYYGSNQDMQLVGKRQFRDGVQMKLAVHNEDPSTGYSTTRLATCWLGYENFQASSGVGDEPTVADIATPAESNPLHSLPR